MIGHLMRPNNGFAHYSNNPGEMGRMSTMGIDDIPAEFNQRFEDAFDELQQHIKFCMTMIAEQPECLGTNDVGIGAFLHGFGLLMHITKDLDPR